MVSSMFESAGLMQAIIKVWLLPPKESDETNIVFLDHSAVILCVESLNTGLFSCTLTTTVAIFGLNNNSIKRAAQ